LNQNNSNIYDTKGIYYPPNSLKTTLCIQGNRLLYKHCEKYQIPYKKITKWIVAQDDDEAEYLSQMKNKCDQLGQPLHFVPSKQITDLEPNIRAKEVLVSPETGIIDSHALMDQLEESFTENDGALAVNSKVEGIQIVSGGYEVKTADCIIKTPIVINCAGLYADMIYAFLKPNHDLTLYPLKGQYFGYKGKKLASRLIYPVPPKELQILGIHLTLDLGGRYVNYTVMNLLQG
jgi:2-hydroxyglutarate dehydrogenase